MSSNFTESGRRICIVANMFDYFDNTCGIGTYNLLTARLLSESGWDVTVLYAGDYEARVNPESYVEQLRSEGIVVLDVEDIASHPVISNTRQSTGWRRKRNPVAAGALIYSALSKLNKEHPFDLIEISDWNAPGCVTADMQRLKREFNNLAIRLHGPSSWGRIQNSVAVYAWDRVLVEYLERKTCERAPHILAPSQYIIDFFKDYGWNIPQAEVLTLPLPIPKTTAPIAPNIDEVVFFGRVESRKGADFFIQAVKNLPESTKVTFLGPMGKLKHRKIEEDTPLLTNRNYAHIENFNREQALNYLSSGNKLAIIPSIAETFGYTVVECATARIPFIVGRYDALPDVLKNDALIEEIAFDLDSQSLRHVLDKYLDSSLEQRKTWIDAAEASTKPEDRAEEIVARYTQLAQARPHIPYDTGAKRTVTIGFAVEPGITVNDSLQSFRSVYKKTSDRRYLICAEDSADPSVVQALKREYPECEVISLGHSIQNPHSAMLKTTTSDFYIPFANRCWAMPGYVDELHQTLASLQEVSAVTCHAQIHSESSMGRMSEHYIPAGGPVHLSGYQQNEFGELFGIYRVNSLREIGGFVNQINPIEGWRINLKLVNNGFALEILPLELLQIFKTPRETKGPALREGRELLLKEFVSNRDNHEAIENYLRLNGQDQDELEGKPRHLGYELVDKIDNFFLKFPKSRTWVRRKLMSLSRR